MTNNWLDWFPIVLLPAKILVVGACMVYSIKWHYDQDQAKKKRDEISGP